MTRYVATHTLDVKCPLDIEECTRWEGCYWVECGCDLEVTIEYGHDVQDGWRVAVQPNGCPLNPYGAPWTDGERRLLQRRIEDAVERWMDAQEWPTYDRRAS